MSRDFKAYYVIYASDDTATAISIFDDYAGAAESTDVHSWIEQSLAPLLTGPATAVAGRVIVHTWLSGGSSIKWLPQTSTRGRGGPCGSPLIQFNAGLRSKAHVAHATASRRHSRYLLVRLLSDHRLRGHKQAGD
jgi:hypothetical protein